MTLAFKPRTATVDRFVSGNTIDRLNPRPSDYYYLDSVRACANLARWGGGTLKSISVLEHHNHAGEQHEREHPHAPAMHHLAAYKHDFTEQNLSDLLKPIKNDMPEYKQLEVRHEIYVAENFGFPFPFPPTVKPIDDRLALTEAVQILPATERGHWLKKYAPMQPYDLALPDPRFIVRFRLTAATIASLKALDVRLPTDIARLEEGSWYEFTSLPALVVGVYLANIKRVALQAYHEAAGRVAPGLRQILDEL